MCTVYVYGNTHTVGCQSLMVRSLEPEAMSAWVGEKATEYTAVCMCVRACVCDVCGWAKGDTMRTSSLRV